MSDPETKSVAVVTRVEVIAAAALGAAALLAYVLQIVGFSAKTTITETALFNTLQFILTLGFTWFSTRAVSRKEFEQSMKRSRSAHIAESMTLIALSVASRVSCGT